jgi:hypothetical protein
MTEQPPSSIGSVAEEAARLISAMAAMAGSSDDPSQDDDPSEGPSPYAGGPAQEPRPPEPPETSRACSTCGGVNDATPVACRLCPLCQGIALLRLVRPETVDRLADFAAALAGTLRDLATQSRASGPTTRAGSRAGGSSDRATVEDIPVADEGEA